MKELNQTYKFRRFIFSYHGLCLKILLYILEFKNKWDYSVPVLAEIKCCNIERRLPITRFNRNLLRGLGDECGDPCVYAKKKKAYNKFSTLSLQYIEKCIRTAVS